MQNDFKQIEDEVSPVVQDAALITVTNRADYASAAEFLKELKAAQNRVTTFFASMKSKAHAAWKQIVADENNVLNPLKEAETSIKRRMLAYDQEERRRAVVEQRRLQKIADAKAKAEKQRQITAAENLKTDSLRGERIEEANEIEAPVIHVQHDTPKVAGISTRTTWKAKIVNKHDFVQAALTDTNLLSFLTVDQTALNRLAQATKGQLNYPGIKFYSEQIMAAGGK